MFGLTNVSPVEGFGSFVEQWKQPTPYRWTILGVSVVLTVTLMAVAVPKTERAPPAKPDVIWINSWRADRSEAEIIASNIANQKRKDAAAAVQKQREELRKEFYRDLARASGMDPDALEREYSQRLGKSPPPAAAPAASKPAQTPAR